MRSAHGVRSGARHAAQAPALTRREKYISTK
jgi:hypothetical protein